MKPAVRDVLIPEPAVPAAVRDPEACVARIDLSWCPPSKPCTVIFVIYIPSSEAISAPPCVAALRPIFHMPERGHRCGHAIAWPGAAEFLLDRWP